MAEKGRGAAAGTEGSAEILADALCEPTQEELRDFLQPDPVDTLVNPRFKQRLRDELWTLLRDQIDRAKGVDLKDGD